MDPKLLIRNKEYTLQSNSGIKTEVIYVHETINHYVFINNIQIFQLTPSTVNTQIYAKQME